MQENSCLFLQDLVLLLGMQLLSRTVFFFQCWLDPGEWQNLKSFSPDWLEVQEVRVAKLWVGEIKLMWASLAHISYLISPNLSVSSFSCQTLVVLEISWKYQITKLQRSATLEIMADLEGGFYTNLHNWGPFLSKACPPRSYPPNLQKNLKSELEFLVPM